MQKIKKYYYLFFLLFLSTPTLTQSPFYINIQTALTSQKQPNQVQNFPKTIADSITVINNFSTLITQLHNDAYLAASVDTLIWQDSLVTAHLHIGQQYEWTRLKNGNVDPVYLDQVGYREKLFNGKPFQYKELIKIQESLLNYAENNGFPFAAIWLDSIKIDETKIEAQLFMERGRSMTFGKINLSGNANISIDYLQNYLDIKPGELYNHKTILKIKDRIRELPFVVEKQSPTVSFTEKEATVNLFLNKKNASRFDFLIGLQPNNQSAGGNEPDVRTFQLTGTFNADLNNQFGRGEKIFVEFQQLRPQTQELNLELAYPYILNLPFGADLKFDLYKRDTAYLDVISDLGVQYFFEPGNYVRVFWNATATNLLTVNTSQILQSQKLPAILDINRSSFGLEYQLQKLNYRFNPRKGWSLHLRAAAGTKKIKKNSDILNLSNLGFDTESLYDSLNLNSFQYQLSGEAAYYIPLGKQAVFKTGVRGGYLISDTPVYQNEQFRIGGNRILRGFDEESIFATNYAVTSLELRFLLGLNSYLFAFGDFAYVENKTPDRRLFDRPIGIGTGITFETKVGLFGFSLAVGKQQNTGFDFRSVKTHFGYVSLF